MGVAAAAMVLTPPVVVMGKMYLESQSGVIEGGDSVLAVASETGDENDNGDTSTGKISMATVKKYGVSGTVAYVLTEVAFWAVAFPVAAAALYNTSGHWPDLVGSNDDRAAVAGFVFAGANIARLAVPLRLGA